MPALALALCLAAGLQVAGASTIMQVGDEGAELEELEELEEDGADYVWLELGEDEEDGEGLQGDLLEDDDDVDDDLLEEEDDEEEEEDLEDDENNKEEFEYFLSLELMEKMERMKLFNLSTEEVAEERQEALVLAMVGEEEGEEEFAALDQELDQMLDELLVEEDLIEEALDTLDSEGAPPVGPGQGGAAPSPLQPGHALHSALLWGSLAATLVLACLALAATYRCSRAYTKVANPSSPA